MAAKRWKYFCFVFVFVLFTSAQGKITRFGLTAESLFFPAESESHLNILHIDNVVESDDVDVLLSRYARSTDAPRKPTEYHLNDNHTTLIVHWAGKGSDVILALAKNGLKGTDSSVFISRNYGKTFSKINSKFQLAGGTNAVIDRYYNTKLYNSHYVFTDIINRCIFTTRDYAMSVMRYCNLNFKPRTVSIHESNPSIIIAMDEESYYKKLYISENFGFSWREIHDHIKAFYWGVLPYDNTTDLYVEQIRGSRGNRVLRSTDFFRTSVQLISEVRDFQVRDQYLFATKHVRLLGARGPTTQLWVSYDRTGFRKAEFPSHMHNEEYYIADASESQVMACVNHNRTVTHLYISEVKGLKFSLSLERVVYFNPKGANNDTWLRYYANVTFADIHKVDGMRGIYIASQVMSGTFDVNRQRSLITFDKGGEWSLLQAPVYDSAGHATNCSKEQVTHWSAEEADNCSLHLTQLLHQFYPRSRAVPILSRKSAPGMILASGVIGKNIKTNPDVFVSANAGISWHQVLEGSYMYTFADHGSIIVAVKQFGATNTIYVSNDEGKSWNNVTFSKTKIRVYGILTEPGETTSIFSIFGSNLGRHSWIITQIDLRPDKKCDKDDYKNWSLPKTGLLHGCLLGRRMVYERKIADALCYNGKDYMRSIRKENCSCTREDFECDFGFKPDLGHIGCVPDPMSNTSMINQVPDNCPSGTYYPFSRGYRRIAGDTCHGGSEHRYMPLMYSCPISERREFILFANRSVIASMDLDNNKYQVLVSHGLVGVTSITFDYQDNCLYWADTRLNVIKRQCFNNNGKGQETIVSVRLHIIEGLAYEWTAGLIYWIDSESHTIEVARKDGSFRRVLYKGQHILDCPRSLVLDPHHGYLYWADWSSSNPRIARAWMDGTEHSIETIVNASHLKWPNGLAIDVSAERLYWTDAGLHQICSSDLNGGNLRILSSGIYHISHPFAIGIYKSYMYWTDWVKSAVMMAGKTNGRALHQMISNQINLVDLKIVSHTSQQVRSACSPGNQKCTQLCLPKPDPIVHGQPNRTCKCADSFRVSVQPSGDEHCMCNSSQERMDPSGNCVLTLNSSTCALGQFLCVDHSRCVPLTWRCDHDNDCPDGSDEIDCPYAPCPDDSFTCKNGRCVPERWKCDNDDDCQDGSDELNCDYPSCAQDQFTCNNSKCISQQWVCDYDNDCHDGSDEVNCTESSCHSWEYRCHSGECVGYQTKCDGHRDCDDGSDERNCTVTTCSPWRFKCHNSSHCIQRTWVCDGESDCADHSDEIHCNSSVTATTTTVSPGSCREFTCDNGFCVWWSSRCDGSNDCGDNSDERYCGYHNETVTHKTTLPTTTSKPCRQGYTQCRNGRCIPNYRKCDGRNDCWDNSDEQNCGNSCGPDRFQCSEATGDSPKCIWNAWVCDGGADCKNGEDERNCNVSTTCGPTDFQCVYTDGCIPLYRYCNGFSDCEDNSDEWNCEHNATVPPVPISNCSHPDHSFRCTSSNQCVIWLLVCDGQPNCDDGSDELGRCGSSANTGVRIVVADVTSSTIRLQWNELHSSGSIVQYFLSYTELDNNNVYRNTSTTTKTTFTLQLLRPFTVYVIGLYVVGGIRTGNLVTITTKQGVPSVPRNFHTQMVSLPIPKIALEWTRPERTYEEVNYLVHLINTKTQVKTEVKCWVTSRVIHFDLTENYLTPDTKYKISVSALNSAGEGPATANKTVTFSTNTSQEVVTNIHVTKKQQSTLTLTWKPIPNVSTYTVRMQYQSMKEQEFKTNKPKIDVTHLCPGNWYSFQVIPEFKTGSGSPSPIQSVQTRGKRIGVVTGVSVKKTDSTVVMVEFNKIANASVEYIVYFIEHAELPEQEFLKFASSLRTNNSYITISGLQSCELYFFRVAAVSQYCPLSAPQTIETDEDDKAPPKHVSIELLDTKTSAIVHWDPPCDVDLRQLSYMIDKEELGSSKPHEVLGTKPAFNNHTVEHYNFTLINLIRGASYAVRIRTTIQNSVYSKKMKFLIPAYGGPVNLEVMYANRGQVRIQWKHNSANRPTPQLFNGFLVTATSNVSSNTYHTNKKHIVVNVTLNYDYTFSVCYDKINGYYGENSTAILPYFGEHVHNHDKGKIGSTKLIAIIVPISVIVLILAVVLGVFVVRHRRLQRSFLAFANSHYDTRSGMTTFGSGDGLDDEDSPMIQGFSDDEPLITA